MVNHNGGPSDASLEALKRKLHKLPGYVKLTRAEYGEVVENWERMRLLVGLLPIERDVVLQALTPEDYTLREKLIRPYDPSVTGWVAPPISSIFLIIKGSVRVFLHTANKDVTIAILGPSDSVGELGSLDENASPDRVPLAYVEALEPTIVLTMRPTDFNHFRTRYPRINHNLCSILSNRLRQDNHRFAGVRGSNIGSRVASQLLYYADRYGRPYPGEAAEQGARGHAGGNSPSSIFIPLRLKQAHLADVIGAVRQTVSGPIKTLTDEGVLSENQEQKFTIYDRAALKAYADGVVTMKVRVPVRTSTKGGKSPKPNGVVTATHRGIKN